MLTNLAAVIVAYRWVWFVIAVVFLAIDLWESRWLIRIMRDANKEAGRRGLWGEDQMDFVLGEIRKFARDELRARPLLHYGSALVILVFFSLFLLSFML